MGFLDKLQQTAKDTLDKGKGRLDDIQADRKADQLLRDLGAWYYAGRTGRDEGAAADHIERLVAELEAHEAEHGPLGQAAEEPPEAPAPPSAPPSSPPPSAPPSAPPSSPPPSAPPSAPPPSAPPPSSPPPSGPPPSGPPSAPPPSAPPPSAPPSAPPLSAPPR